MVRNLMKMYYCRSQDCPNFTLQDCSEGTVVQMILKLYTIEFRIINHGEGCDSFYVYLYIYIIIM